MPILCMMIFPCKSLDCLQCWKTADSDEQRSGVPLQRMSQRILDNVFSLPLQAFSTLNLEHDPRVSCQVGPAFQCRSLRRFRWWIWDRGCFKTQCGGESRFGTAATQRGQQLWGTACRPLRWWVLRFVAPPSSETDRSKSTLWERLWESESVRFLRENQTYAG